ncbi:MAG: UDP-N-acetylglucosamine 2-epimerase (non-hydrolyzing) [Crocinitomicaceae bacterium]|nr:UDP-N-acetylglucosamine 2-epimerase (non-hydrolyzing) [Crocinitomicaceae bacterium]
MKKILTILGARPQFIKAAMLSKALGSCGQFDEIIVHTGQHYDHGMSDIFFEQLGIPTPGYSLGVSGGGHGEMTGRMLCALEPVMIREAPDFVMVYGDTNSTIAGSLTASKLNIPIAHIEAGLRSFNRLMPEEINRVLTDHMSELLYCPTESALQNLRAEGIERGAHLVGDIMFDAALHYGQIAKNNKDFDLHQKFFPGGYILATIHRQENTDDSDKLRKIVQALTVISKEIPIVLPLHPRTRDRIEGLGLTSNLSSKGMNVIQPLGYFEMLAMEQSASLIITDSGGVQKESYFFNVPCITLRDQTEWIELVDMGWNRLVDVLNEDIVAAVRLSIETRGSDQKSPYGFGDTANRIVEHLSSYMGL